MVMIPEATSYHQCLQRIIGCQRPLMRLLRKTVRLLACLTIADEHPHQIERWDEEQTEDAVLLDDDGVEVVGEAGRGESRILLFPGPRPTSLELAIAIRPICS